MTACIRDKGVRSIQSQDYELLHMCRKKQITDSHWEVYVSQEAVCTVCMHADNFCLLAADDHSHPHDPFLSADPVKC